MVPFRIFSDDSLETLNLLMELIYVKKSEKALKRF